MKTIKDFNLNNKKVIIRVDFNVPIKDGIIMDDTRIKESLKTIEYAIKHNAKVILMSHLGRIKEEKDKVNTLKPVATRLGSLLNKEVIFIPFTRGKVLEDSINHLNKQDVLLMENTRFEDLDKEKESKNDIELGKYWASLGDIFINDAFGTSHRKHASNVGIASNLDNGIGFLIEKELTILNKAIDNPNRPFTVILGGAKVHDKILVIENLVKTADYILIGGAMAFTFLKVAGIEIGKSLLDEESIDFCKKILRKYKEKIILPIDVVTNNKRECFINEIKKDEIGLDIGYKTVRLFKQYLESSKTIIWNGPLGMFEEEDFAKGTKGICQTLKYVDAVKIAGGGDTASAIKKFKFEKVFTHISTGGGASLALLEGKNLSSLK
ncbi:MAG: phosphoglycerate kinase [Bacilli bacterium]